MPLNFTKMHGLGNDYVYVGLFDQRVENPVALARAVSDRHRGIGSDGLILVAPPDYPSGVEAPEANSPEPADVRMIHHYGAVRETPADGGCGIGTHPCHHWGAVIVGPTGTVVKAPTNGWVLVSQETDSPPFSGYGPAVVLFAHDDRVDPSIDDFERKRMVDTGNLDEMRRAAITMEY